MTDAEELEWLRNWRTRIISAMRLWFKPEDYQQACQRWTDVVSILNESPPTTDPEGNKDAGEAA